MLDTMFAPISILIEAIVPSVPLEALTMTELTALAMVLEILEKDDELIYLAKEQRNECITLLFGQIIDALGDHLGRST